MLTSKEIFVSRMFDSFCSSLIKALSLVVQLVFNTSRRNKSSSLTSLFDLHQTMLSMSIELSYIRVCTSFMISVSSGCTILFCKQFSQFHFTYPELFL